MQLDIRRLLWRCHDAGLDFRQRIPSFIVHCCAMVEFDLPHTQELIEACEVALFSVGINKMRDGKGKYFRMPLKIRKQLKADHEKRKKAAASN